MIGKALNTTRVLVRSTLKFLKLLAHKQALLEDAKVLEVAWKHLFYRHLTSNCAFILPSCCNHPFKRRSFCNQFLLKKQKIGFVSVYIVAVIVQKERSFCSAKKFLCHYGGRCFATVFQYESAIVFRTSV